MTSKQEPHKWKLNGVRSATSITFKNKIGGMYERKKLMSLKQTLIRRCTVFFEKLVVTQLVKQ
jgi:hypothetical protein